ncbi:adenosine kinase [Amylibacter marinus]|uniref:Adenosine kinase n=1 Tax=Amylibacter marinus TaxID=1475483 RepID=A0ABQ5VV82_9RHOB|nr:adenosine kinase [Amylibacter marinus]GLQ35235.1 adenosine kinase [Amylibacter marinus]
MSKAYQVVGIGNAIVDVLSFCSEDFLSEAEIDKGIMQLIDTQRATSLYGMMGAGTEMSGGSGANTIAGLANMGVKTAYVGKVKDDQLGDIFHHDMNATGAVYNTPRAPKEAADETGRCMVLVTPDGERSMNTYLGVTEHLAADDIDPQMMADADWLYLEGYRFDGPESHAAFAKAIGACKAAGGKVSVTLSDPFCVDRHRDAFAKLIREDVDLLFCNEHEMAAMYPADTLDQSIEIAATRTETVACTVGDKGAVIAHQGKIVRVAATPVDIVDATGAGDLFAAGFLAGLVQGQDMEGCGKMGCAAAGHIISKLGARSDQNLAEIVSI